MVLRYDRVKVNSSRLDSDTGKFFADATIARVGVQKYSDGHNEWYEFRPPEEVLKSAQTFNDAFVTVEHPPISVNAINSKQYMVGLGRDCKYDKGLLKAPLIVTDADAAIKAHTSHKEISCGYDATVIDSPGVWVDADGLMGVPGKSYKYDKIQTNIRGNHIALVANGTARAGPIARVHTDSAATDSSFFSGAAAAIADAEPIAEAAPDPHPKVDPPPKADNTPPTEEIMKKKIKIGDAEYEVDSDIADAYNKAMGCMTPKGDSTTPVTPAANALQLDSLVVQLIESSRKDAQTYQAQLEVANSKIAELSATAKTDTDAAQMEKTLAERWDAFQKAIPWLAQGTQFVVALPASHWQTAALKNANPAMAAKFDSMTAEQIAATFDYQASLPQQQAAPYVDQAQAGLIAAQNNAANYYQHQQQAFQNPQTIQDAQAQAEWAAAERAYMDAQSGAFVPAPQAAPYGYTYDSAGNLVQLAQQPPQLAYQY
jgi:Uncharacterized protein conserved in bacteria (DUF2213)